MTSGVLDVDAIDAHKGGGEERAAVKKSEVREETLGERTRNVSIDRAMQTRERKYQLGSFLCFGNN